MRATPNAAAGVVLAVVLALALPTVGDAAVPKRAASLRILPTGQARLTDTGEVRVRVRVRNGMRVRLHGMLSGSSRSRETVVATNEVTHRLRPGGARTLSLDLTRAAVRELRGCERRSLVVRAHAVRGRNGAPAFAGARRAILAPDLRLCRTRPSEALEEFRSPGGEGCDPTDPAHCLLPFPNDRFTVEDSTTATGRRVSLARAAMPANVAGIHWNPSDHNRNDGFSPGAMIVTKVPGLESEAAFERTGAVPIDDMDRAFDSRQPVVVVNSQTRQRHLVWAEVDSNPRDPADVSLLIRPGRNFKEGERYIVALRDLRSAEGAVLSAARGFELLRDRIPSANRDVEERRPHFERLFRTLAEAGIERDSLYRAWDFTVASGRNLSERMLSIRDDAFAELGDRDLSDLEVEGRSPRFTVDEVIENPDGPDGQVARRVEGRITVPCYLNVAGCPSGSRFAYPAESRHGPPVRLGANTTQSKFTCQVPRVSLSGPAARPSLYGHGLLGSRGEIGQSQLKAMGAEHNMVFCASDWVGMSCADLPRIPPGPDDVTDVLEDVAAGRGVTLPNCDLPNIGTLLLDLSNFATLVDRVQQGILNFLYIGRAMIHPQGLGTHPAFRAQGRSVIDTTRLYYDGNSQGGIIGGALMAVAPDLNRGVLGVPGMNYSTLLRRSVDFDAYAQVLYRAYPDEAERPLLLTLLQMIWDRGEGNGYAHHMTGDPLPNTPSHEVLLHVALGDHQVAQVAAEVEARTIGAAARFPWADPGRDTDAGGIYGIPPIKSFPFAGSAIVLWDSGPARVEDGDIVGTPPPPNGNVPPRQAEDPHELPRRSPAARRMKSEFLQPNGRVMDTCDGRACYSGTWKGP